MTGSAAENVYDVIVICAGPVGQTVADRARAAGLTAARAAAGIPGAKGRS
jgi:pyruvate/2-oxoglutarate dehydrogenase complex dihydrolipoamide dehydrogenase (E3) component